MKITFDAGRIVSIHFEDDDEVRWSAEQIFSSILKDGKVVRHDSLGTEWVFRFFEKGHNPLAARLEDIGSPACESVEVLGSTSNGGEA